MENNSWTQRQARRGLVACTACHGTGCRMTPALAAAFDPANDGKELPAIEDTFCPRCDGLGWLKAQLPKTLPSRNSPRSPRHHLS